MGIRVHNTMTGRKEDFVPLRPGEVGVYVCGVTPWSDTHIGHARPSVVWDVIRRYLESEGYRVRLIQNFTDVDDKIICRAAEEGEDPLSLSARYSESYLEAMDALGIRRADVYPKVSGHVDDIIKVIEGLVDKGLAYVVDGDVFYDVSAFADYGRLSGRNPEDMRSGARVEVDERKDDPMDFALWKKAKEGEPAWESPWGPGRPGWHIECSAMSLKYLGATFDFHGGGTDLIFPHHENEIAQSEGYTGVKPFVRYWVHNGLLNIRDEKMSKSLGNFVTVEALLERYPAEVIRFFILTTHYRSPLEFTFERVDEAKRSWEKLFSLRKRLRDLAGYSRPDFADSLGEIALEAREDFREAMEDDFNTALAIAALFEMARKVNAEVNKAGFEADERRGGLAAVLSVLDDLGRDILGIFDLSAEEESAKSSELAEELIRLLVEIRHEARAAKNWPLADSIRDRLAGLGIELEDGPEGTRYSLKGRR